MPFTIKKIEYVMMIIFQMGIEIFEISQNYFETNMHKK